MKVIKITKEHIITSGDKDNYKLTYFKDLQDISFGIADKKAFIRGMKALNSHRYAVIFDLTQKQYDMVKELFIGK